MDTNKDECDVYGEPSSISSYDDNLYWEDIPDALGEDKPSSSFWSSPPETSKDWYSNDSSDEYSGDQLQKPYAIISQCMLHPLIVDDQEGMSSTPLRDDDDDDDVIDDSSISGADCKIYTESISLYLAKNLIPLAKELQKEEDILLVLSHIDTFYMDSSELIRLESVSHLYEFGVIILRKAISLSNANSHNDIIAAIVQTIFPLGLNLFLDTSDIIVECACENVSLLLLQFDLNLFSTYLMPLIDELSISIHEENLLVASKLIGNVCKQFKLKKSEGKSFFLDVVEEKFIPVIRSFSTKAFKVRESVIETICQLASIMAPDKAEQDLLFIFSRLCDDSLWNVRKSAAIHLPAFSSVLGKECKINNILPIVQSLLNDVSRLVRMAINNNLGPLIYSFRNCGAIPEPLISAFVDCIPVPGFNSSSFRGAETDTIAISCAFNLPAVVFSIGPENWNRYLKGPFSSLAKHCDWRIRRPISFALYEIAKLLPPSSITEDIVPIFSIYINDIDQVKLGVLQNLSNLFSIFTYAQSKPFLSNLILLVEDSGINWKYRAFIARYGHLELIF
ncbi:putative regulatory subunit 1 of protein phosphatase 4 [Mitosporidium daphniae]|uniref:Putative regulatory subunit 1 of protein phosphatase 4 n=1 Tax=Mitosporidium daphniae TaxID=1485682 RepID=A0A098VQL6_9MICR|nr:putative regulatory subunit 1 of protein phosphatase 4 [Mitosporidium daphniae]KGG51114.1 putative regulatory subunit 1 of protein phosphatase 4 [Mitosporidium daphniae]|eukprot:XP_013237541.1 putative regulatory subunit 1 of protein phosphatase 4 [Mitosporidium daphniae]